MLIMDAYFTSSRELNMHSKSLLIRFVAFVMHNTMALCSSSIVLRLLYIRQNLNNTPNHDTAADA